MKRALVMTGLTTILIAIGLTASAYALIRHASPGGDRTWRDTAAGLEGGHAAPEVSGQRTSADAHRVRDLGIGPLGVVLEHQGLALGAGKALSGLSQGLAGCDTPARTRSVRRKWPFAERPWLIAYWPVSGLTGQNWMNEPAGGGEREPRSGVAFWQATGQRLTIYTADRLWSGAREDSPVTEPPASPRGGFRGAPGGRRTCRRRFAGSCARRPAARWSCLPPRWRRWPGPTSTRPVCGDVAHGADDPVRPVGTGR